MKSKLRLPFGSIISEYKGRVEWPRTLISAFVGMTLLCAINVVHHITTCSKESKEYYGSVQMRICQWVINQPSSLSTEIGLTCVPQCSSSLHRYVHSAMVQCPLWRLIQLGKSVHILLFGTHALARCFKRFHTFQHLCTWGCSSLRLHSCPNVRNPLKTLACVSNDDVLVITFCYLWTPDWLNARTFLTTQYMQWPWV